ncbi:MAG: gamma-glutamyl-phosphate reductase, partial [Cellvibrionaceae bacterium]|nr:gamma-glutamyl-phosphate reductase [Cellvibrionaceae bacterium]
MNVRQYMYALGEKARAASRVLSGADTETKNRALHAIAEQLHAQRDFLISENCRDLENGRAGGLESPLLDRLELTADRIESMISGLRQVASLPDPCGEISEMKYMPSGIQVGKMRVPLGVVAIIYESRPNVTIDGASL